MSLKTSRLLALVVPGGGFGFLWSFDFSPTRLGGTDFRGMHLKARYAHRLRLSRIRAACTPARPSVSPGQLLPPTTLCTSSLGSHLEKVFSFSPCVCSHFHREVKTTVPTFLTGIWGVCWPLFLSLLLLVRCGPPQDLRKDAAWSGGSGEDYDARRSRGRARSAS